MNAGNGSAAGLPAGADQQDLTAGPLPVERAGLATALRSSGPVDPPGRRPLAELPGGRDRAVTRILLITDEPIVGAGLRTVFEAQEDLGVVGEERDASTAAPTLPRCRADVIVLDVHAAGATLCDAVRTLLDSRPRTAVLLVGGEEDKTTALRAITAGARAYLPSHVPTELVVQVVRTIAEGGLVLPGGIARDMARQLVRELDERDAVVQLLSEREHGVLVLLGSGRSNAEIAQELFISEATVKKHVSQILRKLRRRDRLQAALYASELGLGHEPPPAPEHTG